MLLLLNKKETVNYDIEKKKINKKEISKNGVLPVATLFYWKFDFSLRTS